MTAFHTTKDMAVLFTYSVSTPILTQLCQERIPNASPYSNVELLKTNWSDSQVLRCVLTNTRLCLQSFYSSAHMSERVPTDLHICSSFPVLFFFPPLHVMVKENVLFLKWDLWMLYLTKNYLFRDQWRHTNAGISNFYGMPVLLVANIRRSFCAHRLKIHWMENQPVMPPARERHIWDERADTLRVFIS